jgi:hypothetical protein
MFELNRAIADWRGRMADAGIKGAALDELESHLREDAERQIRSGTDPETAFQRAVERMGTPDKLEKEFGKIAEAKGVRSRERLRRWSVIIGTAFVYTLMGVTWFMGVRQGKIELTWIEIALALGAMVPMVGLGWAGRNLAKFLPLVHGNWVIAAALAALLGLAMLFRMFFDAATPASLVQVQILTLWILSPLLGFGNCVSAWYERCRADRAQRRIIEA